MKIKINGKVHDLPDFLGVLRDYLIVSETFNKSKDGFLMFNKYKTSEKTLEEI